MVLKDGKRRRYQSSEANSEPEDKIRPRKIRATLYDAVAGRASYNSMLPSHEDRDSKYRDTKSTSRQAIPPDEVLFRRAGAPARYEEHDIYFANEQLSSDQKLPDSDLLKYIHSYASRFYHSATATGGAKDWKSMDETALLALGILLEETAKESLGQSGDLAFIEDERDDDLVHRLESENLHQKLHRPHAG